VNFTLFELVGAAAFLTNVCGNLLLAWKSRYGWLVRLVSIVLWGIYAVDLSSPSLLANAITFFGINCVGWWKWRKAEAT
jgi:hypothetical protein